MPESAELIGRLRAELEQMTPDLWPHIRRRLEARRISTELLTVLSRPPSPGGSLYWELLRRVPTTELRKAG
jgi:hypothetical protein